MRTTHLRMWRQAARTVFATVVAPCIVACFLAGAEFSGVWAAEPTTNTESSNPSPPPAARAASSGPIEFQRIYVPADRPESWPRGAGRYLPMASAEFERLLQGAGKTVESSSPRITRAEYRASPADDGLLAGSASFEIVASADRRVFLALGTPRLAVKNARWRDPRKTTTLGLGSRGELALLVEQSGRLRFDWTLSGRRGPGDERRFDLDLPPSAQTVLVLELPDGVAATCDPGVCVETSSVAGRKTWRFELGGQRRVAVRLSRAVAAPTNGPPDVYETHVYRFAEEGVELKTDLRIEGAGRPLRRVHLLLDPELKLVTAQFGQTSVKWSILPKRQDNRTRVVVELPETPQPDGRVLHLTAWRPLVLDRPWRLPRIRSEGTFWREGNATLAVPLPLCVERLRPIDGRQSRVEPLAGSVEGEKTEFQFFSPDATVELTVTRPKVPVQVDCVTNVELDGGEAAGEWNVAVRPRQGELFELEARVASPWIIDEVTCGSPGTLRDWRVSPASDGGGRLVIRLAKPLRPDAEGTRFKITGRWLQSPLGRELRTDDLTPVRFTSASSPRNLMTVRARSSHELVVRGDDRLRRILSENLDDESRRSPSTESNALSFIDDARAEDLRLELVLRRPGYACETRVTASVSPKALLESYRFRCTPKSSEMDAVLIHFLPARRAPPQWSLGGEEDRPLSARRLTRSEQVAAGAGSEGETWRIPLEPARSEPFEIRASRIVEADALTPISLAAAIKSQSQTATLVVRAEEAAAIEIVNRGLVQVPTSPPPSGEYQTARGTFRYSPEQVVPSAKTDLIAVRAREEEGDSFNAFAWNCRMDSRFGSRGGFQHLVTYRLENGGRSRFRVSLPGSPPYRVREVRIDGRIASWRSEKTDSGGEDLLIDLPPGKRFPVVSIGFLEDGAALSFLDSLRPPVVTSDVPVLAARWIAWIPASHRAWDADNRRTAWRGEKSSDTPGWRAYRMEFTPSRPARLTVFHETGPDMLRWIALLVAFGLGAWLVGDRPARLAGTAAVCGILAVLLPEAPAAVASGGFLGMLLCAMSGPFRRRPRHARGDGSTSSATDFSGPPTVAAATKSLKLLLLAGLALGCIADSRAAQTPADAAPLRVLIPVDDQRKPVGGEVYVPETLYRRLSGRAIVGEEAAGHWLLENANYQGKMTWEGTPRRLVPGEIRARFFLRAFDTPTRVRLPLSSKGLAFAEDWAFLNGRVIRPEWEPAGSAMTVLLPAEGYYRLDVVFTPTIRITGSAARESSLEDERGFEIHVPRAPRGRLTLELPANAPTITVPSAQGPVTVKDQCLSATLGGADRLRVLWRANGGVQAAEPVIEVEQLLWLNVTPGSVAVDARFHFRVPQGRISEIRLSADPRLQLLGNPSIGRLEIVPCSPQDLLFRLPAPRSDDFTLSARFSLQDASGIGRHRVPLVAVDGAKVVGRWFAASVDPSLKWTEDVLEEVAQGDHAAERNLSDDAAEDRGEADGTPRRTAVSDFLAAWGGSDETPLLAYRHRDEAPRWSIATRPLPSQTTVDSSLRACFAAKRADACYEAHIDTTAGSGFCYRLRVPTCLEVESLAVFEEDVDRLSRWSRARDGAIELVLAGPATARRRLVMRGSMNVHEAGTVELPLPRFEDARERTFHVTLLREPSASIELERRDGFEETQPDAANSDETSDRRTFASLINTGGKAGQVRLRVSANSPKRDVRGTSAARQARTPKRE
ncbi:MAG TPA: hypothetical protein VJL29_09955, partial [Thermoguttaceae bacterium]|nr:hypothetical protein [Thermoguttaceae bacterium]